ncbi:UTRA domain-containing protein [Roseomonas elaeocarpi]|uniref:UTRA domain-containing protein n=1 Tax=Roseomonas elaeocarpi TaxID=907779 RepID=A0ABV6JVY8_9PROT
MEGLSTRIRAAIEGRILSGEWRPGHRIPSEAELAAAWNCSRMTVNKALSALSASGLINRRRRAGSFVAEPAGETAVSGIADFAEQAARQGQPYGWELLSRAVEGGTLRLQGLHRIGGIPVAAEDRAITLGTVPEAAAQDFASTPPGSWLLRNIPWTEAEHVIRAVAADAALAALLEVPPGAACLLLERRTWNNEAPVTEVRLSHAAERHRFVGRFHRAGG